MLFLVVGLDELDTGIAAKLIRSNWTWWRQPNYRNYFIIVTGIIFTSTFGAGAVVAIGIIVLPFLCL